MTGIDYFAWAVLIVIIVAVVGVFIVLAMLPGKIAKERRHPQAEAINIAGWLGAFLTLGAVWVFAMIWAFTNPDGRTKGTIRPDDNEIVSLKSRIAALEAKLETAGGAGQ